MSGNAPFAICLGLALVAFPLAAQQGQQGQQPPGQAGRPPGQAAVEPEPDLMIEREVFSYPTFQRRNPFRSLVGAGDSGPRFEQIQLRGIVYTTDPAGRLALMSRATGGGASAPPPQQQQQQQQQTGEAGAAAGGGVRIDLALQSERLRIGESWGNTRVIRIERDHVVVEVTEFGLTEQHIMTLRNRRQGGPS